MAPLPQEPSVTPSNPPAVSDDDIVISGVSGMLPNCASYQEFLESLYQNKNLVGTNTRWENINHPDLKAHCGRVGSVDVFDAQFFSVWYNLAQVLEPTAKKLLEQTYQAIFDSGNCPMELSGKKVGVYISADILETEYNLCQSSKFTHGLLGCSRTMFPNRVSFWLNLKGPSMTVDASSMGALVALEKARDAIVTGVCEAAIVGCGKLVLLPHTSIMANRVHPLNDDGKTKCYDEAADGQSLSEAVNVIFLQKYKDAKRVYATLRHVKTCFGASPSGGDAKTEKFGFIRDTHLLSNFLYDFYDEAGVAPSSVEYVEGFGAASPEVDRAELVSLQHALCKDRANQLLVGSVTSNVGMTENASAYCAIFKLLAAYQKGEIAATINCRRPRRDVPALCDGRMGIVTENTTFNRTYTAVNSFTDSGLNGHVLLQGCYKPKDLTRYHSEIPHLITVSGRLERSVEKLLNHFKDQPLDPEEIALIHNIHRLYIPNHLARGFGIYSTHEDKTITHAMSVQYYNGKRRPLCFVYSGMGSQWIGMGADLMRIPIFREAIERCHKILEPKGIDLINIITTKDKTIFDNILHSFVGISAIQIGLTDVLTAIGLVPNLIIGHSLGELGCAYADGCFTAEQVVMLAYLRGLVSLETSFVKGAMAAVGLGYMAVSKICPRDVEVACHNSSQSSTISGPYESVLAFVKELREQGVFAKEVQCSNIAYHSSYVAEAGPNFLKMSNLIVPEPKLRSPRWISSSMPQGRWSEPDAAYSSAEYHTHNFLSTVLFEEALGHVPDNAVLLEVSPHGLLQAILKRALPDSCCNLSLTNRVQHDNALFALQTIGRLYEEGYDSDISALYPKVEFPVSTETRSLSHLVEWEHKEKWKVLTATKQTLKHCSELDLLVTVEDDEYKYLNGHFIEGVRVFPFAAMLVAVWDVAAMTAGHRKKSVSVKFFDVRLHSQPSLDDKALLSLTVSVHRGSGRFEVFHDKSALVEGYVVITGNNTSRVMEPMPENHNDTGIMEMDGIYRMFFRNGYEYKDQFRSIERINYNLTQAEILWRNNWVTFIDGVLQTNTLRYNQEGVSLPSWVKKIVIDIKAHLNETTNSKSKTLSAIYNNIYNKIRCGGLTIEHIHYKSKPTLTRQTVTLNTYNFVPFHKNELNDVLSSLSLTFQMVAEHLDKHKLCILYVSDQNNYKYVNHIKNLTEMPVAIETEISMMTNTDILEAKNVTQKPDAVIVHNVLSDKKVVEAMYKLFNNNILMISIGVKISDLYPSTLIKPMTEFGTEKNRVELVKFKPNVTSSNTSAVSVRNRSDISYLRTVCRELHSQDKLIVLSPYPTSCVTKTMVTDLRKENKDGNIALVTFDETNPLDNELDNIPDMPFNTFRGGLWGSNYYLPLKEESAATENTVALRCMQPGNINTMYWTEVENPSGPGIEVDVHYAGLSVLDSKRALAVTPSLSTDSGYGMDFSGVTASGERVMGLMAEGSACTKVRVRPELVWPVPAHWSLEEAATVPLAYSQAFYCLIRGKLKRGMKILVHGGTGGLGQAVISIALAYGCEVFATVSNRYKKRFLRKRFPELQDDHIGNSRDATFGDMVRRTSTHNGGVCDVVISCVKGYLKHVTLACCNFGGCIVDVTQLSDQENFDYGMTNLTLARNYCLVDLSSIFTQNNYVEMRQLQALVSEGIARGYVTPLPAVTYAADAAAAARALRLLAASHHLGRVLLSLRRTPLACRTIHCVSGKTNLVICDRDGLGVQWADTLVSRGANLLHLHCHETAYVQYKVQQWTSRGVRVTVSSEDISTIDKALDLIRHYNQQGPIAGIYIFATDKEETTQLQKVVENLDSASRVSCSDIRHFAVISEDDSPWRDVVSRRAHNALPALSLHLEKIHRYEDSEEEKGKEALSRKEVPILWGNALNALNRALCSGETIVYAHAQPATVSSILKEVSKIPGVNITIAATDRTTLEQVGADAGRAREVCNLLARTFGVHLAEELVPALTIAQLRSLEKDFEDVEKDPGGFADYFSEFERDELEATTDFCILPSLRDQSKEALNAIDADQEFLCMIPGLEGHYRRLVEVSRRLRIRAAVLNLHQGHGGGDLAAMAETLARMIMQKLKPKGIFYLLGYDFGVLVAMEVAAILESYGLKGTVFMLGGTPEEVCDSFNCRWKGFTTEQLQDAFILHMFQLISGSTSPDLENQLKTNHDWSNKVECYSKALKKKVASSTQYTKELIEGAYARIRILQNYVPKEYDLKSEIVLLRAKLPFPMKKSATRYPNLHVHQLRTSIALAYKDLSCSNIINKYLDRKILDAYENSNQCVTTIDTPSLNFQYL